MRWGGELRRRKAARAFLALVLPIVWLGWPPPTAEACGTAACSLSTRTDDGRLPAGQFHVDVSYRYLDQDRRLDGHRPVVVSGASDPEVLRPLVDYAAGRFLPGYHHDWGTQASFLQIDVGYGFTSRFGVLGSVPVVNRRKVDHLYFPGAGPANHAHLATTISRQDLTTSGFGDSQISFRFLAAPKFLTGLAVRIPTGPFRLKDESDVIADPMIQPGTGAWGILGSVQYIGTLDTLGMTWTASAAYQRSFTNELGYRNGDEIFLIARASRRAFGPLTATLQGKVYRAARNTFRGQPSPSTGTVALYAAPGVRWSAPGRIAVYANLQVPLYQHMNEAQLGVHTVLQLGLSRAF